MTDFSFKDEDEVLQPSSPSPATPKPTASPPAPSPNVPLPTAPPSVPSPPLPTMPGASPMPTAPTAPTPNVPLPSVALPQSPPTAPSPTVPLPTAPTARPHGAQQGATAQGARPQARAANTSNPTSRPATAQTGASAPHASTPHAPTPHTSHSQSHGTSVSQASEFPDHMTGELERRQMHLSSREQVNSVRAATWHRVLDMLTPFAFWALRVGAALGGLALAYLLWGIFSGALQSSAGNTGQAVTNVRIAISILNWSLLAIAVSCLILLWEEKLVAVGIAVLGLLFYFGAAPLMATVGTTNALRDAAIALQKGGLPLLVLGGLKYGLDMMRWVMDLPNRMRNAANVGVAQQAEARQQHEAQNATMFSPCWKLPFCREVIRKQCPAYLARTTCWKFGRGCYCDEEMISRIIRGESLDTIKAPTRMSRQGKPPCGRCYIFLEHQGMKYKAFSPLAIPLTIGIMYFGWSTYLILTGRAMSSLSFLWDRLAFQSTSAVNTVSNTASRVVNDETARAVSTLSPEAVQHAAQVTVGILLGFTLLIYISKAIEWAIYKARW